MRPVYWMMIVVMSLCCACQSDAETLLYVAPNGNDAWSGKLSAPNRGRTDGPLATLKAARDAARKTPAGQARRIVVRKGDYYLAEPLTLGPEDCGLSLEAMKGEKVTLYGGRTITGWEKDGDRFWSAKVADLGGKPWDFRMLSVNGVFAKRSRLPETGSFTHLTTFDVPWMSTTGGGWKRKPTQQELTTMKVRPEDLGPWMDIHNAELTVYHMWDESVVGVAAYDAATSTITFSNPAGHPPGAFGVKKYVAWNLREGMKEPGQWYLDRTAGRVVYWPRPGEDMSRATVIAPTMESIIRVAGTKETPVTDVRISGLALSVTNTPLKAGGFGAGAFDGAVSIVNTRGCKVSDCTVARVGGQGIKAWNSTGIRVEYCEVTQTGACGIFTPGDDNVISDNRVHHIGVTYPSAIAVWAGAKRMQISHNEIHDVPYSAIACGGEDNTVEGNRIYRAMQELHDGAAIYITFCKRNAVRGNFAYDIVETGGYGCSAYYLDEQAEGCIVEGNVSDNVNRPSHNHMAKNNAIRNNIFVIPGDANLTFPKCSEYTFERNVLSASGKIVFSNPPAITTASDNVIYSGTGKIEGCPANATLADPLLSIKGGVYGFKPGSPAAALGLKAIDTRGTGPRKRP